MMVMVKAKGNCLCILLLKFILFHAFLTVVSSHMLTNDLNGSLACPGQTIRFVCRVSPGSPQLIWSSPEYIGPSRIEFSENDRVETTREPIMGGVTATLLETTGGIESELIISASLTHQTASVTCGNGTSENRTNFEVPGVPGMPQNVRAIKAPPHGRNLNCVILFYWDHPIGIISSAISHYIFNYQSGSITALPHSTAATVTIENCDEGIINAITISIHAIDICGRDGARTNNVIASVLQATGNAGSQTGGLKPFDIGGDLRTLLLIIFVILLGVIVLLTCVIGSAVIMWKLCCQKAKKSRNMKKSGAPTDNDKAVDLSSFVKKEESTHSHISELKEKLKSVKQLLSEIKQTGKPSTKLEGKRLVEASFKQILDELEEKTK